MVRFAEEMRHVGGEGRDHPPPLVPARLAFHQREVAVIAGQIERAQAFGQPRLHHAGLAGGDHDPRLGMRDAGDGGHLGAVGQARAAGMVKAGGHATSVWQGGSTADRSSTRIIRPSTMVSACT